MEGDDTGTTDQRRRKFSNIAEHLELQILSGRIRPGDRLKSERAYMAQFGAGRSSVREALFSLQRKGLITLRLGARAEVVEPSAAGILDELMTAAQYFARRPQGVRELQGARVLLEGGLARTAALNATDEDLVRLEDALQANLAASDPDRFIATDLAFHRTIASVSRNSIFMALELALSEWLREQRNESARAGASMEVVRMHHSRIFRAIADRDPVAAQAAMEAHLNEVMQTYWRGRE